MSNKGIMDEIMFYRMQWWVSWGSLVMTQRAEYDKLSLGIREWKQQHVCRLYHHNIRLIGRLTQLYFSYNAHWSKDDTVLSYMIVVRSNSIGIDFGDSGPWNISYSVEDNFCGIGHSMRKKELDIKITECLGNTIVLHQLRDLKRVLLEKLDSLFYHSRTEV